jgi:hypothetical protein
MTAEKQTDDYARQDVNETLAGLEVDAARGLSDAAVRQRLTRYTRKMQVAYPLVRTGYSAVELHRIP